jgi:hypothetical protein
MLNDIFYCDAVGTFDVFYFTGEIPLYLSLGNLSISFTEITLMLALNINQSINQSISGCFEVELFVPLTFMDIKVYIVFT